MKTRSLSLRRARFVVLPVFLATWAGPAWAAPPAGEPLHGLAAYYAGKFHGRTTSNGERHDSRALMAAHRTLPFGTRLKVTNLANGRSVIVVVNDRGPWNRRRILDLSRAAAERLDFVKAGVVKVRAEVLREELVVAGPDPCPPVTPESVAGATVCAASSGVAVLEPPASTISATLAVAVLPGPL